MNMFWLWSPAVILFSLIVGIAILMVLLKRLKEIVAGVSDDVNDLKRYFHLSCQARTDQQRREYFFAFISKKIHEMIEEDKGIDDIRHYVITNFGRSNFKRWKEYIYYIKKEHDLNKEHHVPTMPYRGDLFGREEN